MSARTPARRAISAVVLPGLVAGLLTFAAPVAIASPAGTTGICMDAPRDDIEVGDTAKVVVQHISDGTKRLAVIRDDENQHGIVEVRLTALAWAALITPSGGSA